MSDDVLNLNDLDLSTVDKFRDVSVNPARKTQPKAHDTELENEVNHLLGIVQILYTAKKILPPIEQIMQNTPLDEKVVLRHLKSPRFRDKAQARGIGWPDKWSPAKHNGAVARGKLTPEKAMILQIMTDPTSKKSFGSRLKEAGISNAIWSNWLRDPVFSEAVRVTSEQMLDDNISGVHTAITSQAMSGNIQAARLFYELNGRHDPNKQQMLDFGKVVGLLLEVLQRHITDIGVLSLINKDIDTVLSGGSLKEVESIPANYVEDIQDAVEVPDDFFEPEDK